MQLKRLLIVFIGAPGSGKGTQAVEIVKKYGIEHLSTGALLRNEMQKGSFIGLEAKKYIESGKLVPDNMIIEILKTCLAETKNRKGMLLDGFPRTVEQAKMLEKSVESTYRTLVLHLHASDETVLKRITGRKSCISCQAIFHTLYKPAKKADICDYCQSALAIRSDDNEATVRERLHSFHEQTDPVIEFYTKNGQLHTIDGEKAPIQVQSACDGAVSAFIDTL